MRTGLPLSSRFHVTVAVVAVMLETAVTWAPVSEAWLFPASLAKTAENFELFCSRDALVVADDDPLKNSTQFVAIVFAVPVRLAGTPEGVPPAAADVEVAAGAEVVAAGAEVAAGADEDDEDELDELLLHAAAVSVRQATPAAQAITVRHLGLSIRDASLLFVG